MQENLLLSALPAEERERLNRFLEPVAVEHHQTLIELDEPITHVYFPANFITSTLQEMSNGAVVEVGLMGIEGLVGIQVWLRQETTPTRTVVQVAGEGVRMPADAFRREVLGRRSPLNDLLAAYAHGFLVMTSQVAVCNRLHTIDERLCRWLKLIHNRAQRDEFELTQDFIAQMLGAHRPTVSTAARMLQNAGLISYSRGRMTILDSDGLRAGACECLELMEQQFDKIFGQPWLEAARREKD